MASPSNNAPTAGKPGGSGQPLTPPADFPVSGNNAATIDGIALPPQLPATSLQDNGKSRRPRDARLIHMLLASQGVTAYQERVPLQLLDFAYRYTSSTLQDAVYLVTEGYPGESGNRTEGNPNKVQHHDLSSVSLQALRMSIASRLQYQFNPTLPKDFLMDMAAERNRIILPGAVRGVDTGVTHPNPSANSVLMGGVRLPPERFCQTGISWDLKDEWESEGEEDVIVDNSIQNGSTEVPEQKEMDMEEAEEDDDADDDEGDGRMEDIFGEDSNDDNKGDETMSGI